MLAIDPHSMRLTRDHSADKVIILAGRSDKCLVPSVTSLERRSFWESDAPGASGILQR